MKKRKKSISVVACSCCIFLGGCSNGFVPLWWGNMPRNEAIDMQEKIRNTPDLRKAFEDWDYSGDKSKKTIVWPKPIVPPTGF